MNWRKPIIYFLLTLSGSRIPEYLREIERINRLSEKEKKEYQKKKLEKILFYAWQNVPYYHSLLEKAKVIVNGQVNINNFSNIPILTKEIIRKEEKNLYSTEKRKGIYENTSGGSTGEPVRFLQDKYYDDWNKTTVIFFNEKLGKSLGQKEIKLWGSDRDIIKGNLVLKDRLINKLYNRKFFNSYNFSENDLLALVRLNNQFKPIAYWSYMESAYEFSKFILKNKVGIIPPKFLISTIGPLYPETRETIKKAMGCRVYNQYGSREVGAIACQFEESGPLKVFFWHNYLEIEGGQEEGELLVTTLNNYSMPLIRYQIGDAATASRNQAPLLQFDNVIGRTLGYFKKKDGQLKHTHFLVQQLFFRDWIKQFQIIQKSYALITCRIALRTEKNLEEMKEIEEKFKMFMGPEFQVKWEFVEKIKPTKSGKFLYNICELI